MEIMQFLLPRSAKSILSVLPKSIGQKVERADFDRTLEIRENTYLKLLKTTFKSEFLEEPINIVDQGDWHAGTCSIIVKDSNDKHLVIKPRSNKIEVLLENHVTQINDELGLGLHIPKSRQLGSISFHEYCHRIPPVEDLLRWTPEFGPEAKL